jgi:RNA-directed DNA polymerase
MTGLVTCKSKTEAKAALRAPEDSHALGVALHPEKTRIVHVRHGFEFLGFKIKRGQSPPETPLREDSQWGRLG